MYEEDNPRDLEEAAIIADQLQAAGDVRGELLALELASVRATSTEEAHSINREAARLRDLEYQRLWPRARTGTPRTRAGLIVDISCTEEDANDEELSRSLQLEFTRRVQTYRPAALGKLVERLRPQRLHCTILEAQDLERMPGLEELRFGYREHPRPILETIAAQGSVRRLRVESMLGPVSETPTLRSRDLRVLAQTRLEALALSRMEGQSLALLREFEALEALECHLCTAVDSHASDLAELHGLRTLSLWLRTRAPRRWAEATTKLPLRRLRLTPYSEDEAPDPLSASLDPLFRADSTIEDLSVAAARTNRHLLARLPALRRLALAHHPGPVEQLGLLPPLERVSLQPSMFRRLRKLPGPGLEMEMDIGAKGWIARLLRLRRRGSPPLRWLQLNDLELEYEDEAHLLRAAFKHLEHLIIFAPPPTKIVRALAELPMLRRLTVRDIGPNQHRTLSARLPHVLVESTGLWPRSPR